MNHTCELVRITTVHTGESHVTMQLHSTVSLPLALLCLFCCVGLLATRKRQVKASEYVRYNNETANDGPAAHLSLWNLNRICSHNESISIIRSSISVSMGYIAFYHDSVVDYVKTGHHLKCKVYLTTIQHSQGPLGFLVE